MSTMDDVLESWEEIEESEFQDESQYKHKNDNTR